MARVGNVGAIFMDSNITTTSPTKHVDIMYNYLNEYAEDKVAKIAFVKSTTNDNIILTINVSAELHEKHLKKMVGEKL